MRVFVIGGGGREHALVWKLNQSPLVDEIFCAPGNGGISEIAECINIKPENIGEIVKFVQNNRIDFTIVGPEVPLALGLVNELPKNKAFGPTKEAATIESDKAFAKELMNKMSVPTAESEILRDKDNAFSYLDSVKFPVVIKASGLAAGKGVIIAENKNEAIETIEQIMGKKIFGSSGNKIIIEEYLEGEEVSVLAFTDGKDFIPLLPSQDHKKLYDGDKGPNTGGMGAYSPVPFLNRDDVGRIIEKIFEPTVYGLKKQGAEYKGVLYAGLILTEQGPKVLEFNCRFGDPETQPILPLLESDLMEPILATVQGGLGNISLKWKNKFATCVVLASGGYPNKYEKNKEISGLSANKGGSASGGDKIENAIIFHSGTKKGNNKFYTNGGRVLGITSLGDTLKDSIDTVYRETKKIDFDGMYYRKDIGKRELRVERRSKDAKYKHSFRE